MPKVSIIGVGDVGVSRHTLPAFRFGTEIVLATQQKGQGRGEALDMNDGVFFTAPVRIRAGEYADCALGHSDRCRRRAAEGA